MAHTVNGIASTSPAHPQSIVQNTVGTSNASDEIAVCAPYNQGSTTLEATKSRRANRSTTSTGGPQPWNRASARTSGKAVAASAPTYGTIRNSPAITPQSKALGTPIKNTPVPKQRP